MSATGNVRPAKPTVLAPVWHAIPQALRERATWVCWRLAWCSNRWSKVPCKAVGTGPAATDNPGTWATFEQAKAAVLAGRFDGVGLVLTDDLVGVDLDHVIDLAGDLEQWAAEVVERFAGAYVERSPSGDGLHIFCRGKAGRCGKGGPANRLEVYDRTSSRYFTVTGQVWQ